jgi:hypothetical protein
MSEEKYELVGPVLLRQARKDYMRKKHLHGYNLNTAVFTFNVGISKKENIAQPTTYLNP